MNLTIKIEQDADTGELVLPIPQSLLEAQGWTEGDNLEWTNNNDGSWTLSKVVAGP